MLERKRVKENGRLEQELVSKLPTPGKKLFAVKLLNNHDKRYLIRKVKDTMPSPFYDGKYHPPLLSSVELRLFVNSKIENILLLCE